MDIFCKLRQLTINLDNCQLFYYSSRNKFHGFHSQHGFFKLLLIKACRFRIEWIVIIASKETQSDMRYILEIFSTIRR